ncbi:TPA: ABC transporter permease [Vibrio cholerae]|jgi:D-methionine transport system permease protein|uniref:Probable D-methionine transport system permease protein MetI n=8 Tax=Vibrio cholerae TaxID=666 RepID=METI_VIBCH|nr:MULTISPECIES: methionine ABC transporter permease [Vibrio]Q9KTJ6.1 RecName: Full=Probable D-methionine transport system permease protein MetI [Vibrio cholerae O1 biovar El Tor str. N16961]AEA78049.1 Methionine ABC transporter permease protein [Vibrio cholerae LMA3984-4]EAZ74817.1 ABC transporter, permease protein [Vibrio cholerae NCTC 8457]EEY47574.1 methionine ABC transporter permease protein [Vibrio cholerae INDRE 91/1]EYC46890.1 methionine ABC transporter permease [Vibrio cholerae O1 bio
MSFNTIAQWFALNSDLLLTATWQTLYMVAIAGAVGFALGIPLGVILHTTKKEGLLENLPLNRALGAVVNIGRSVPFLVLMVAIIPVTKLIVGTFIGTTAAIVPLTIGAIPFVARLIESALLEVPTGLVEAAQSMGATPLQIIRKVLLPEALPTILNSVTITLVTLVSYSAMAGTVGGGGLGDVAIRYGFHRYDITIMAVTVVMLIVLVQIIQSIGDALVRRVDHR